MRNALIETRKKRDFTQEEVAKKVGVSHRYYQKLEAGTCKPNVETAISIADLLKSNVHDLFGTPQRQLRENDTQGNFNTIGNSGVSHSIAAAELSEVKSSEMVAASEDLQDGRADTPEGEMVLRLMRQTGGAAIAV